MENQFYIFTDVIQILGKHKTVLGVYIKIYIIILYFIIALKLIARWVV